MNHVKKTLIKYRSNIIIVLSVLLVILALSNIVVLTAVIPISNDECVWIPVKQADTLAIEFEIVKVNGVTWNAGIRDGDYLIAINGINIKDQTDAQRILDKVHGGDYAEYRVKKKDGRIIETKVYIKKLINFPQLGQSMLGLFGLLIAFIVLIARPDGKVQRIFFAVWAMFILKELIIYASVPFVISTPMLAFFIALLFTGGIIYAPFLILHFFCIFPREYEFVKKKAVRLILYLLPTIIFIGIMICRYLFINVRAYNITLRRFEDFIGMAFLSGFVLLLINYFRIKSSGERKPFFIILVFVLMATIVILYYLFIAPMISDTMFNSPEFYMPMIILFILPVAFGYSIFKYQLMDVSLLIKNTIIYGAATITIAAIYFLTIYIIGQTISTAIGTEYKGLIAGIIFITFALVFQSTKDRFQNLLTAKFYPEQLAYQRILVGFSNEITTVVGLDNILDTLTTTFVESLKIKNFGIMLFDEKENEFQLIRRVGISYNNLKLSGINLPKIVNEKNANTGIPVIEEEDFSRALAVNPSVLINEGIYTIIPMIIKQKIIGLMLLGLKHSGAKFAGKDLDHLNAVANQSAVAIENARLYLTEAEKLKMEKLHEVDELKSRFFANISHEFRTPLTLILGPAKDIINSTKETKTKQTAGLIKRNAGRLLRLVNQLLDLSKLEAGKMKLETREEDIVPLLKGLVLSFSSLADLKKIKLDFSTTQDGIDVYLDKDKIEKIVNNLLSNAFKFTPFHSPPGRGQQAI